MCLLPVYLDIVVLEEPNDIMSATEKRLESLRVMLERLKNKEKIPDDELAAVGLKPKEGRIKDIEKAIKATRSLVSSKIKSGIKESDEQALQEEADERNMTLEDLKEEIAKEGWEERNRQLKANTDGGVANAMKAAIGKEREKKQKRQEADEYDYDE